VIGLSVGYLFYKLVSFLDDKFIQMILTFIAMYGSYQIASSFYGSGIISVAVAGIIMGNFVPRTVPQRNFEDLSMVWEFLAFIVTSISFILIGMDVNISLLGQYSLAIILSIFTVLAARATSVYGLAGVFKVGKDSCS